MTEWELKHGPGAQEPADTLPTGHLPPKVLRGRPAAQASGWSPTAWKKGPGDDRK